MTLPVRTCVPACIHFVEEKERFSTSTTIATTTTTAALFGLPFLLALTILTLAVCILVFASLQSILCPLESI